MFSNKHLIERLDDHDYQGKLVAVEYTCGSLMKKAIGYLQFIGNKCDNYLELSSPFECKKVIIKTFSMCGEINKEKAIRVLIPLKDVCSIERIHR